MDDHCRRHIWHVPAQTQQTNWFLFSWIKGFELSTSLFSHDFWVFHMQSSKKTCLSWFHMMISYFVMGKPEILHSSQPRKAFRPRPKKCGNPDIGGLWWRSLGEKHAISSLCWSVLRHVEIDLCGKKWRGDPSRDNIADIHRLITDVLQLDNDTKKCWFLEEFVAANIMGIVRILHMLSCKRTHSIGSFFSGISMIFDVMFGPKSMKWHDQLWCFPLYFGTRDDRSGWEHHRTMMFGQEVTHRPVGKHMLKLRRFSDVFRFLKLQDWDVICNVVPATQNVL